MRRIAHKGIARRSALLAAVAALVWVVAPGRLEAQPVLDTWEHGPSTEVTEPEPEPMPAPPTAPGALPRPSGQDMPPRFPEESDGWAVVGAVILGVLLTTLITIGGAAAGFVIGGELASCSPDEWFCGTSEPPTGTFVGGLIGVTVGIVITTALVHDAENDG